MRLTPHSVLPALLAVLLVFAGSGAAGAQPVESSAAQGSEPSITIDWEVRHRFRLFRRESDFQRHVAASRAGSQFAAEHLLQRDTAGRGWAQGQVDQLCVNATGALVDTCDRDGERESYLAPKSHLVVAKLAGT